jgi:hypothetical protein
MLLQVVQRGLGALVQVDGDDVLGHDVAAADLRVQPLVRLQLDLPEQGVEVLATDVEELAIAGEGGVEVCRREARAGGRHWVRGGVRADGDRDPVRIAVAGHAVEYDGRSHQQD